MQIGSLSAQKLYGKALDAARPGDLDQQDLPGGGGGGFTQTVVDAAQDTVQTIARGEEAAKAMMAGKADAHSVVEALAATEMALEMAVTVRDKVVEAYQEILRMPI